MARLSFPFARSHLILLFLFQLFVSGTHAFEVHCDDFGLNCHRTDDDDNESSAQRRKDRIIGAAVIGGCLVLSGLIYAIYVCCTRRKQARLAAPLSNYAFAGPPATFAPPPGPPPPVHPAQGAPHAYSYGYGYGQNLEQERPQSKFEV